MSPALAKPLRTLAEAQEQIARDRAKAKMTEAESRAWGRFLAYAAVTAEVQGKDGPAG